MDKIDSSVFVMTVNDQGQNVYTDQSDPTKSYIFDDEGNITDFGETDGVSSIKMESNLELEENNSTEMEHLEDSSQLEMMSNLGHVFEDTLMEELDTDLMKRDTAFESNCIMQHMDIREPLSKLKKLLEARLNIELPGFLFCLQGSQMLESHKTLVDQCVQGEGLVQVNLQIQANLKRINIIDVLKPADDYIEEVNVVEENTEENPTEPVSKTTETPENNNTTNKVMTDKVVQWQLDLPFKREQERLKIPTDPKTWNILHVRHWVQWAVRQFNLPNIKLSDWSITGGDLYRLTIQDFQRMAPQDNNDIFWTHFELLRKMKVVATIKEGPRYQPPTLPPPSSSSPSSSSSNRQVTSSNLHHHNHHHRPNLMKQSKINRVVGHYSNMAPQNNVGATNSPNHSLRSGHNGQIQLWQFLLEMLTARECRHMIAWEGTEGEFKLLQPEQVATLWGDRKNKPTMNYEKLSRALRYYYDGDMISKVQGKRFVYKFVCDLRQVLGYSALELARLIDIGNPLREGTGEDLQEGGQQEDEDDDVYDGE